MESRIYMETLILTWKHNDQVGNITINLETSVFIWKHEKYFVTTPCNSMLKQ